MMPFLVKSDDVRSERKAKAPHGRLRAAQESMGSFYWQIAMAGKVVDIAYPEQKSNEEGDALKKSLKQSLRD